MAFELNPLAVTAAPLLRAIDVGGWVTKAELAESAGRLPNHIARDIASLEKAGLVMTSAEIDAAKPILLTDDGIAQLAALDRASNPTPAQSGTGQLSALHADLKPHPLNPRKDFDSDEAQQGIDELRESAVTRMASGEMRGLMQPIVVRPRPETGKWWIVDGERRWRAVAQAIWDGDWPEDMPVPIMVRQVDDREHLMLSLTANLQRTDMSAIEEAVAFHAAVRDFGVSTETLASELGKSQRYVQQRIALLKLDDADQDRMRLARDHPDHLSFKAARALTQTPREPSPPPVVGHGDDEVSEGLAIDFGPTREPGSPYYLSPTEACVIPAQAPEPEKTFDDLITDKEALVIVELADRIDRFRLPDIGDGNYCQIKATAAGGAASSLILKGVIGFRQTGDRAFATVRLSSTPAGEWLRGLGFADHRADVLFEARAKVLGPDKARDLGEIGRYATDWLNLASRTTDTDPGPADQDGTAEDAEAVDDHSFDLDQPHLIEPSEDERAARAAHQLETYNEQTARTLMRVFADKTGDWMAFNRMQGRTDYASDRQVTPEALATQIIQALALGELTRAAAAIATLHARGGRVYRPTLTQMPSQAVVDAIATARSPDGFGFDAGDCAAREGVDA